MSAEKICDVLPVDRPLSNSLARHILACKPLMQLLLFGQYQYQLLLYFPDQGHLGKISSLSQDRAGCPIVFALQAATECFELPHVHFLY